jgi:hypothetical protein
LGAPLAQVAGASLATLPNPWIQRQMLRRNRSNHSVKVSLMSITSLLPDEMKTPAETFVLAKVSWPDTRL